MKKIRINGLKLSAELVLLHVEEPCVGFDPLAELSRQLGDNQINILFMSTFAEPDRTGGICCIDLEKKLTAEELINKNPQLSAVVRVVPGVGLLTLFPHQSSLRMMGLVLENLGKHHIRIYAMASSIATITFVIDYQRLDDAAGVLYDCLELPQSAAPARSILRVRAVDQRE